MARLSDKIQTFVLGLLFGVVLGGGFFLLKLDDYFKELKFYKNALRKEQADTLLQESAKPLLTKKNNLVKLLPQEPKKKLVDSLALSLTTDSLSLNKLDSIVPVDEIVVRKDEMITSKQIEAINISSTVNVSKDSLLASVSGINTPSEKNSFSIEFWQSPINYKGYKLNKNKIVIYGIPATDELLLYKIDGNLFLKHASFVYRLVLANDFKQFEKINDEQILAKLK